MPADMAGEENPHDVSTPAVMLRRNKKPVSCEPCRLAKVRCDHTFPICDRCAKREMVASCYYHPAPLTHKTRRDHENAIVEPAKNEQRSRKRKRYAGLTNKSDAARRMVSSDNAQGELAPRDSHPKARSSDDSRADIGFFGSTSFMSVFNAPEIINTAPLSSATSIGHWLRDEHQYRFWMSEVALVKILCSQLDVHGVLVKEFYERSYFTAIPAPLMLHALSRTLQFLQGAESSENRQDQSMYSDLASKITKNSEAPIHISATTTFEGFLGLFSGEACRWEFVGLIFAISGFSAVNFPDHISSRFPSELKRLKGGTFAAEMLAASNACIEICEGRSNINDVFIWLRYSHGVLASHILGDMNIHLYRRFGEFVTDLFAMGFHRQQKLEPETPFFLSETRKRIFAAVARRDKSLATYLGRPPLIHRLHCDIALPLDLDDADLILTGEELNSALRCVDREGWNQAINSNERLRPATVIRLRYHTSILRERVLDLSLGQRTETLKEDAWELLLDSQQIWDAIPSHFRYDATCWDRLQPTACLVSLTIFLEYLYSVFQIQRVLRREDPSIMADLCSVSMQMLSAVLDLTKQNGRREEIQERYSHLFLFYGIPSAGVLAYELRDCTLSDRAFPTSIPRSKIIRNLNSIVSWFENTAAPSSRECGICAEVTKVISRLLDDALNYTSHGEGPIPNSNGCYQYLNGVEDFATHVPPGQGQTLNESSVPLVSSNSLDGVQLTSHETSEQFLAWLDNVDWGATSPGLEFGMNTTFLPHDIM